MFESPIACNEALDQHYKAICWAGKSGGIEALATVMGNYDRNSVKRVSKRVLLTCYIALNGNQCTRQCQSTDVKVWDNSPAQTLSFGKETADQAIQQGNARKSEKSYNNLRVASYGNGELGTQFLATVTGNWAPNSFKRVPKGEEFGATTTAWEGIGGNSEKMPPKSREFGATAGIGGNTNPPRIFAVETNAQ
ncbi:hypothetical protein R3P38DRAFT_2787933 [Favolaschia claudopus]|uniref:Uncharacterized protein n=1 Tax=Favolaschia claudopus TaxID=2862362 RepID=A0AAW0ALA3_9AGAR